MPDDLAPSELLQRFYAKQEKKRKSTDSPDPQADTATFLRTLDALEDLKRRESLEEYYGILSTYTLEKWNQMPWPLSPILCALKGWECLSTGMLRCSVCRRTCSFDLFSYYEMYQGLNSTDQIMRSFLIDQFTTRFVEPGHDEKCVRQPLLRASLVNQFASFTMKSFRSHLGDRLSSLLPVCEKLPVVVAEYDEVLTAADALTYISKFSIVTDATLATNTVALALHGWKHCVGDGDIKYLHCRECRREVEYSRFCTVDRLAILQQNESANFHPDMFSWPKPEEFRFDCRLEHLSWCPWIRPVTISNDMCAVLSLKGHSEKAVGCDITLAAFAVELGSTVRGLSGDVGSNFDEEVETFRQSLNVANKEMTALRKALHESRQPAQQDSVQPS